MKHVPCSAALLAAALMLIAYGGKTDALAKPAAKAEETQADLIAVSYENYNQAETARNFNNWAKLGGNNTMLHLEKLSPVGQDAPTIRMNLDTLYSVGVYDNDGEMTVTIPESNLYQSFLPIHCIQFLFYQQYNLTWDLKNPYVSKMLQNL